LRRNKESNIEKRERKTSDSERDRGTEKDCSIKPGKQEYAVFSHVKLCMKGNKP
jgi:hypothetical protein